MKGIKNVRILTPSGIVQGNLVISEGKIKSISHGEEFSGISFDDDVIIVPGFVDEHIHGVNNCDAMDGSQESLRVMTAALPKEGTTSFLATTMTQSVENITKALEAVRVYCEEENQAGAEIIGVHLEGPFLNPAACGAQPLEYIVNPDIEQFKKYQEASGDRIKFVTVAPEQDGGLPFVRYLKDHGVIPSIGHTKATYDDAVKAIEAGASSVTHCYNAMTGLHHREPGVVGAVLLHDELQAELIADGVHVHPKAMEVLYRSKGAEKITLVTDSLRAKGLPDGTYDLGGQDVSVKNGEARLPNGSLAGSTLKMHNGVKNMIEMLEVSIEEAVQMASTNPAKKLGVFDRKGSIEVGKDADLVVLNSNYEVLMTICRGKIAYKKEN